MLQRAITEIKVVTALHVGRAVQGKVLSHQCGESSLHVLFNSITNVLKALELMGAVGQLFISDWTAKFLFCVFFSSRSGIENFKANA